MIHRRAMPLLSLLAALCLLLSGCGSSDAGSSSSPSSGGSEGAITPGVWDGSTFSNGWSDLKVTLPDGWTAKTGEEMSTLFEADANIVVNDGAAAKDQLDFANLYTYYDFFVVYPASNTSLALTYHNLLSESNRDMTEAQYFSMIRNQLESDESSTTKVEKEYDVMIAGQKFFAGHTSVNDGAFYLDYFLRKTDGAMICLLASYTKDSAQSMQDFLNSFTAAQ